MFDTDDRGGEDPRLLAQRDGGRDPEAGPLPLGPEGPDRGLDERAEFIGKQLAGKKAQYAGDPAMQDQTRKFGVVPSNVIDVELVQQTLAKYGGKIAPNATITYPGTTSTTRRSGRRAGACAGRDHQAQGGRRHLGHPARRRRG